MLSVLILNRMEVPFLAWSRSRLRDLGRPVPPKKKRRLRNTPSDTDQNLGKWYGNRSRICPNQLRSDKLGSGSATLSTTVILFW